MRLAILVAVAGACGGSPGAAPDAVVADAPAGATAITVLVYRTPLLFSYRDGQGPWQSIPPSGEVYTLAVTGPYEWFVVCPTDDGRVSSQLYKAVIADGNWVADCLPPAPLPPPTATVTGTLASPGTVYVAGAAIAVAANDGFSVELPEGSHDVVAADATAMLAIRDVTVSGPTSLGALDVDRDGTALQPSALAVAGAGTDTVTSELDWTMTNDAIVLDGTASSIALPPPSLVAAQDVETLSVLARDGGTPQTSRIASVQVTGTPASLELALPAALVASFAVSGNTVSATWSSPLGAYDDLTLTAGDEHVTATAGWVAAAGAAWLAAFDDLPPGYDPAWQLDASGPFVVTLDVEHYANQAATSSLATQAFHGAALPRVTSPSPSAIRSSGTSRCTSRRPRANARA